MIIQLSEDWRVASDPLQWILQRRKPSGQWTNVGYFGDLERAVLQAARRRVRLLRGTFPSEVLLPLQQALAAVHADIRAALAAFQTEAAAYAGRAGQ